jgi:hypothetical protein
MIGKKIGLLNREQREILSFVVGTPPGGRTIAAAEAEQRISLYDKITDGGKEEILPGGVYGLTFKNSPEPFTLILKNSEWNICKNCFTTASYPSMIHYKKAMAVKNIIDEAPDCELPDNP